jgi:hypothetical protein
MHEFSGAVWILLHDSFRTVSIPKHADLIHRAKVQIPEHVTRGKRCYKKFFRIVARLVAMESGIAGRRNGWFIITRNYMVAPVTLVSFCSHSVIARPLDIA